MEQYIGVSYKLTKSENFDEYMKALGVGLMTRKLGNSLTPTVKLLLLEDGSYSFVTTSTFKTHVITFKPGVEFDEETADGRKVKTVVTFNNNKMTQVQKDEKATTTIVREFQKDQMKAVFTIENITCTRLYERV